MKYTKLRKCAGSYKSRWFLLPLLVLTTVGCVGNPEPRRGEPSARYDGPLITFEGGRGPQIVGRSVEDEAHGRTFSWAGTTVSLSFHGTSASVELTDSGRNQYLVFVDGKPKRERMTPSPGRSVIELVAGLPRDKHSVGLYKLNEPLVGATTVHGFVLDPSGRALTSPASPRPRIEILGDSISTGYGNEGENETCGFSPETQNHYLTYGAKAARSLGADLTTIAWSGKGVFTNRANQADTIPLPLLWGSALPEARLPHGFHEEPPRAVVINLGTNDFAPEVVDTSPFAPKYAEFLANVRQRYPLAHILVTVGPLLTDAYPEGKHALTTVREALTKLVQLRVDAGDSRLHYLEFSQATPQEGLGCDFHPSLRTHARMAETLAAALRAYGGFSPRP